MANNISVKDALAATQVMKTTETAGVHTAHHNVDSSALPTGAATEATLLLIETAVDGIEALLAGTLTVTGTVAATQSGTWNIGSITTLPTLPAGANNIGSVNVADVVPGTGATNLGKAEDAAHTTGDVGVMALSVRTNTATARGGTDGDYQPLITDTNGRLHVITGPSTSTIEVVGDAAHDAAVAGNPVLVAGYASATAPANVSAHGDTVRAWYQRNGAQSVGITAAGALIGGDATNGLDVDVTRMPPSTSGGAANVASSATNVTLLASNAARKGASIMNDSTEVLYVKFGATASATSFHVKMAAGSYLEVPFGYTGIIDGIWASANGSARVGEFT